MGIKMKEVTTGLWRLKYHNHHYLLILDKVPNTDTYFICSKYDEDLGWKDSVYISKDYIKKHYKYISDCHDRSKLPSDVLEIIDKVKHRFPQHNEGEKS